MNKFGVTAIGEILYDVYPDRKRLGGAPFNFIYHVWKFLGKANFISSVGDDENGREMIGHLNSIGFDTSQIHIDKFYPTGTVKVNLGEDKIPRFTISPECSYDFITLDQYSKTKIENETDLLYFGTLSTRSEISRSTIQSLFRKSQLKYFCDLNLRHNFYSKELIENTLRTCNVIKINLEELNRLREFFNFDSENDNAVGQLLNRFDIDLVGLTLGETGSVIYNKEEKNFCKAEKANVIDTLGAGDAYSALLCIGYLSDWKIEKINKTASKFAGEICTVEGALPQDDSIYLKYRSEFPTN